MLKTNSIKLIMRAVVVIIISLLVVIILQTIVLMRDGHRAMTVLVPMTLGSTASVSTDSVNAEYLSLIATSMVSLRFNFTPKTIEWQYQSLSRFLSPAAYASLNTALHEEEKSMVEQNIMSSFAVTDVQPDIGSLQVKISGVLTRWVQGAEIAPAQTTFILQFENVNGTLVLSQWLEQKK